MWTAEPGGSRSFSKRVSESLNVCLLQPALCVLCFSRLLCCGYCSGNSYTAVTKFRMLSFIRHVCRIAKSDYSYWLRHVCLPVSPLGTVRFPLNYVHENLCLCIFFLICEKIQVSLKSDENIW
jgi:hypothetical protein